MDCASPRLPRQAVLVLPWPDGHLEAYAESNIDIRIQRIPLAGSFAGGCVAEDLTELMLPKRYRDLWRADRLRCVGSTRPLTAAKLQAAFGTLDSIAALNEVAAS